ncbi:LacI family DNA-binding transcriptional regulator [Nakamurella endophytica]|uniref:LacI family transcriptional regulator n=1 Tax=Nakamurella endophytica TaxID=1748367 RepID=A0A917TBS9_9ACTN|nr:LacI family DNA-binding transcriptional regulator [Nakamurella endophytica]GGM17459.1 LacI family transcriptional regulator [Nakamurella endophytica]
MTDPVHAGLRPPARLVDIAAHAGVSLKTVTRVLKDQNNVTPETRERVLRSVAELSYVGDAGAAGLRTRKSGTIGLIIPDVRNGYYSLLARAIEERLSEQSPTLLLGDSDEERGQEERYLRTFRQHRVDGLIVLPAGAPSLPDAVREIPSVIVDRTVPSLAGLADHVLADHRRAAGRLVEHLVRHHRLTEVAFLGGDTAISVVAEQERGYQDAVAKAGRPAFVSTGHRTPDDATAGALQLFRSFTRPFGVFTTNNRMFWGAMGAIARLGLRIPTDVLLTTIDSIGEATVTGLRPTQGVVPASDVAARSMQLLERRMAEPASPPTTVTVDIDIEFGTTCGCVPLTSSPLVLGSASR